MVIIETPSFTRQVNRLMSDGEYRSLQILIVRKPEIGKLIPASGGLRKIRWRGKGVGKQKGSRIIYYWARRDQLILMLAAYRKSELTDLTRQQLMILRNAVKEEFK